MLPWLSALRTLCTPAILVTLASTEGSTPREAGAHMLVTAGEQYDTIGGGHLEWRAIAIAREMLLHASDSLAAERNWQRLALGPSLGQCCGGAVQLAFERILPGHATHHAVLQLALRWQRGENTVRCVPLETPAAPWLCDDHGMPIDSSDWGTPFISCEHLHTRLWQDTEGRMWLIDRVVGELPQLLLFGAGHVGSAIVHTLAPLPCRVLWVDSRAELFHAMLPSGIPANTLIEVTDTPEATVNEAPSGGSFLVATHSHALDLQLTEQILRRQMEKQDIGWFGLIGSHTKRQQFERRLRERAIHASALAAMHCPIGLPSIHSKLPAAIAVAVAAQLLSAWEPQAGKPATSRPKVTARQTIPASQSH